MEIKQGKWKKLILEIINNSDEPVGSWSIVNTLKEQGIEVSSATIGRELNQLEMMGLVEKNKFKGRSITPAGREKIQETNNSLELEYHRDKLSELINSDVLENFLMVLDARIAIERQTAILAAQKITESEIEELQECLDTQFRHAKENISIADDDIAFHKGIAKASKNKALLSLYIMLSTMGQQSEMFEHIRKQVGDSYTSLHLKIFEAIKERNPEKAEKFMLMHLDQLKIDIDSYCKKDIRIRQMKAEHASL